jgi:predicted transcriptional regulator
MMEVVSVKVDKETRERMRRLSRINWSETIRRAIEDAIAEEELKERNVDPKDISEGLRIAESVRRPSKGWNSTKEIRKWRDLRE